VRTQPRRDLSELTLGDLGRALRRYQPFILAVAAIVLVVAFLPGKQSGSSASGPSVGAGTGGSAAGGRSGGGSVSGAGSAAGLAGGGGATGSASGPGGGGGGPGGGVAQAGTNGGTALPPGTPDPFCNQATGREMLPTLYAPVCVPPYNGNNGGATYNGVSGNSITVAVPYNQVSQQETFTEAQDTDSEAQIQQTEQNYVTLFEHHVQTYGRKVNLVYYNSSYNSTSSDTAEHDAECQADANKVALQMHAFVSFGECGTNAYENTLVKDGVLCFCTVTIPSSYYLQWAPYVWGTGLPDEEQAYLMRAEMVCDEMAPNPPQFAGETDLNAPVHPKRSFGLIWPGPSSVLDTTVYQAGAQYFAGLLKQCGVNLVEDDSFPIVDPNGPADAQTLMAKFKSEHISDVIVVSDPIDPVYLTTGATKQGYFPEWVVTGSALTDETHFGRLYDQTQWRHAFGLGLVQDRVPQNLTDAYNMYNWQYHAGPPANDSFATLIYPFMMWFFTGVQEAGPQLTPYTFQCGQPPYTSKTHSGPKGSSTPVACVGQTYPGIFGHPISPSNYAQRVANSVITWGDHLWPWDDYNLIDDGALIYWDPTVTGPDENNQNGVGMYRYMYGGKRFLWGQFPKGNPPWFNAGNTQTIFASLPGPDTPPSYPNKCYYMC